MNTIGQVFRVSIFGESHGPGVGVTIDGCRSGLEISLADFIPDLKRRQAGAAGTTPRVEKDEPTFLSGVFNGFTTGAPLTIWFENTNTKSGDYDHLKKQPRPGHADWVAMKKFNGFNDHRGGGHFSGRLTLGLVAAGVVAKKHLSEFSIQARLVEAGGQPDVDRAVADAVLNGDSIGGIVEWTVQGLPVGLGEPFFDSVESKIAHLTFAIPAIKGIEFGSGFSAARMTGSVHNDPIIDDSGKTLSNHAGGINGGITNGNDMIFRVAVKPTSSTAKPQETLNIETHQVETLKIGGRHDTCIALRVPVVLEAVTAIALTDLLMVGGQPR